MPAAKACQSDPWVSSPRVYPGEPPSLAPGFFVGSAPSPISARIAIADVQPQCPIARQNALHFREDGNESVQELRQRGFQANLLFDTVIPHSPIRRRSHDATHALGRQPSQDGKCFALEKRGASQE